MNTTVKKILKISFSLFLFYCIEISIFCLNVSHYEFVEGLAYLQKGDFKTAAEKLELVIKLDNNAYEAYKQLIQIYIFNQEKEKIKKLIPNILNNIEDVDTLINIANILLLGGEKENSQLIFSKVLKLDPNNQQALLGFAQISFSNDINKSIEIYNKYLQTEPDNVEVLLQLALAKYKQGNIDEAKLLLEKIDKLDPEFLKLKFSQNYLQKLTTDYYNKIEEEYDEYLKNNPQDYETVIKVIILLLSSNNLDLAKKYIRKIEKMPKGKLKSEFKFYIALYYEYTNEYRKAIKYMEEFIKETKVDDPTPYLKLGFYNSNIKKYKIAEKYFKFVRDIFKETNANILLALLYLDTKQFEKALETFIDIEKKKIDFARVYFYIGYCYDRLGNFSKAEEYFKKSIEIYPDDHESYNYLGYSYVDRDINLDLAEKYIRKALDYEPKNPAYIDSLGWLYFKQGKYKEAEVELEKAAGLIKDAVIYEHIADVKLKLGKNDEATEYYKKALKLDPKNKNLKIKLKRLK